MKVTADSPWVRVTQGELATGDFVAASIGSARLFAVITEDQGRQLAMVLYYEGSNPDPQFPPPVARSLNDLSDLFKFTGATIARAVPDAQQSLPGAPSSPRHGTLFIVGQVPWVSVETRPAPDRVIHYYLNLQTGAINMRLAWPDGGTMHYSWELVAVRDNELDPGLLRVHFDT